MSILNIMWAGGSAFSSVHKVHHQILLQADARMPLHTWLLRGGGVEGEHVDDQAVEWNLSSERLKGRYLWKLMAFCMRARFKKALPADLEVVLLDGLGVARVILPLLKDLPQVRAVVLFHGASNLRCKDRKLFDRFSYARLTVAAVSQTLAQSLEDNLQRPVTVLRSAFDPAAFRTSMQSREQARSRLGLPVEGVQVLGAVGRLVHSKGFLCLLDAFADISPRWPDARLVIIGEGTARERLEARIADLGLHTKVVLTGHLTEAPTLYRAFDWVAVPSSEEGLGLILQEAVMAGVPVLTSELAVFREQLAEAGCYAPADDACAWSQVIEQALASSPDAIAARQLQALAPEQAWADFTDTAQALLSARQ
ncbi:glycosyltransferase [Pseudomonas sp. SDO528_S397]